jgi:aspartate-semialdehyde dehydrogenase
MEHTSLMMPGSSLDLRRSLFTSTASAFIDETADVHEDEELPFAVDSNAASSVNAPATSNSSSHPDASASAIQFAQKLGKLHVRPTFASTFAVSTLSTSVAGSSDMDRLADQLAEFRSFGASLNLMGAGPGSSSAVGADDIGGGGSSSTNTSSTPISLKT